jgi:crotonobetainyl-CoA:carnitine CoA-transferase CaiB-like acyl-CoA transferase
MATPLGHLRVVDVTDLRGAMAGRILADLGANVIKVEPPGGDPARLQGPFAGGAPDLARSPFSTATPTSAARRSTSEARTESPVSRRSAPAPTS